MAHPMVQVKPSRRQRDMSPVHPNAAAIDIGARMHVAAVGPDRDPDPVRTFKTFTDDLHRLADWFEQCGVKTVAMESTGVYWIPIYEILEPRELNSPDKGVNRTSKELRYAQAGYLRREHRRPSGPLFNPG